MITVNIHEAKTQLSRLIDRAVKGESFVIAKAGKPLVKVTALDAPAAPQRLGFLAGEIAVPDDFDRIGRSRDRGLVRSGGMTLLVDTHLLLWATGQPERLSAAARDLLEDPRSELLFSPASLWDIAIKRSLGREDFRVEPRLLRRGLLDNDYIELPITSQHAVHIDSWPRCTRIPSTACSWRRRSARESPSSPPMRRWPATRHPCARCRRGPVSRSRSSQRPRSSTSSGGAPLQSGPGVRPDAPRGRR